MTEARDDLAGLVPCPFCGSDKVAPALEISGREYVGSVQCGNCWARGPRTCVGDWASSLVRSTGPWNKRAAIGTAGWNTRSAAAAIETLNAKRAEAVAALDRRNAAVSVCPYMKARPPSSEQACKVCGAGSTEPCRKRVIADATFVAEVSAAIRNEGSGDA